MLIRHLILCQSPAYSASLKFWLAQTEGVDGEMISAKTVGRDPEAHEIIHAYEVFSGWIESQLKMGGNNGDVPVCVAITDLCGYGGDIPRDLSAVTPRGGWASVLGMLILSFPEVHWVFANGGLLCSADALRGDSTDRAPIVIGAHLGDSPDKLRAILDTIKHKRLSPLCDASGLRHAIRTAVVADIPGFELPLRSDFAVAIDEERSYAWLHAYTAYRFGFRSQAITTYAGMEWLGRGGGVKPALVFEDYFLQFGDKHPDGFSRLSVRDASFPWLAETNYRILITSGHHRGQDFQAREDNPLYLRALRARGQWNRELYKPLGGIFNLWKDSGLRHNLGDGGRPGLARDFNWPINVAEMEGGHSTPGRLLLIADNLIARAYDLLPEVRSIPQAVYGALLSLDALELLGSKTPTTSLEALALKHHFEVLAECQFVGMQEHVDVAGRMEDIQREVKNLSGWFGARKQQRAAAAWNAELSILNRLIEVFRTHNLFDEEQVLLVRARKLHRRLRFTNRSVLAKPLELFPWYVEKLVASFQLFVAAIVFWVVALGGLYAWVGNVPWGQGLATALTSFLSIEPPADHVLWAASDGWNGPFWLIALTLVLGFTHLGIFISHLYSIISRK